MPSPRAAVTRLGCGSRTVIDWTVSLQMLNCENEFTSHASASFTANVVVGAIMSISVAIFIITINRGSAAIPRKGVG